MVPKFFNLITNDKFFRGCLLGFMLAFLIISMTTVSLLYRINKHVRSIDFDVSSIESDVSSIDVKTGH